jgi:CHASE2 domain-containing sensor protein
MRESKSGVFSLLHRMHNSVAGRLSIGLLLGILILVIKVLFLEHTGPYASFRLWMYGNIQRTFKGPSADHRIQLVDISKVPTSTGDQVSPGGAAVSREYLFARLEEIARYRPKSIGVDVDFSPDENGNPIAMGDPEFFAKCKKLSEDSGVPIFLGVNRQAAGKAEHWLGEKRFESLAAGLGVGNKEFQAEASELKTHVPSVLKMLVWTKSGEDGPELKSLAYAVAERDIHEGNEPPGWLRWAIEVSSEFSPEEPLNTQGFLVSYRLIDQILGSQMPIADVSKAAPATFTDKFVLLGDVRHIPQPSENDSRDDMFLVPGRKDLYSGVILHGCAVDTLVNSPLRQWTHVGRIAVDLALAICALLMIEWLKWMIYRRRALKTDRPHVEWLVTFALAMAVIAISIPFANKIKLVWDDAVFVAVCLILHTFADQSLSKAIHRVSGHHEETSKPDRPPLDEPESDRSEEPQCVE